MKQFILIWLVLWTTPCSYRTTFNSVVICDHNCSLISVEKFPSKIEADAYFSTLTEAQQKRAKVVELNEE